MINREKVISKIEEEIRLCEYWDEDCRMIDLQLLRDVLALLKAQEARHRLEVHNIGNVDIPEGVTWEQFQAIMNNVVDALEHTDKGESWPYEDTKRKAVKQND